MKYNVERHDFKVNNLRSEVAKTTLEALQKDEYEIVIGMAQGLRTGSRNSPEQTFQGINGI